MTEYQANEIRNAARITEFYKPLDLAGKFIHLPVDRYVSEYIMSSSITEAASKEVHNDPDFCGNFESRPQRLYHGNLSEWYVQDFIQFLYLEYFQNEEGSYKVEVDMTPGLSKEYAHPDLECIGYNAGVKTAPEGFAPIISKYNKVPQVITCIPDNHEINKWGEVDEIIICGLADAEVSRKYLKFKYRLCKNVKKMPKDKLGFWGYPYLTFAGDRSEFIRKMAALKIKQ